MINEIYNLSCENGLKNLESNSIDFVCIDPPYTDGINDVLKGHKIQTKLDIDLITKEHFRVLKENSFYAVFGMMPTIVTWYQSAINAGFVFKEDITWVKRQTSNPFSSPLRMKELIYIFKKGNPKFYKTKGLYEDVKLPLIDVGCLNIDSIHRYISELWSIIKNNKDPNKRLIAGNHLINDDIYKGFSGGVRASRESDFTNVWSFLPENKTTKNNDSSNHKHPTVKPILLLERLIELCTFEDSLVLDSFMGSGTTFIACQNTNRNCIGFEIDEEYCNLAKNRINKNNKLF